MRILGMVSHTHDTGVALIKDGELEFVVEEERLNRDKKTKQFPSQSLHAALTERDLSLEDVDCITMPWHIPTFWRTIGWATLRKFPRSLNLVHMRAHPPQQNQLFQGTRFLAKKLRKHFNTTALPPIKGIGHHDSHAAAYYISPFEDATVLVMDGYGDDAATSLYVGEGDSLRRVWHTHFFNSLGILYTIVTKHLGFHPNCDEGKVMGLAAYGESTYVDEFQKVLTLTDDGRYRLNMDYFDFDCYGLDRPFKKLFYDRFGPARQPHEELFEHHYDLAFALQAVVENAILHLTRAATKNHSSRNLCLVGGVALNCVANAKILAETEFHQVWIPPNASDTGATMGSALWEYHQTRKKPRQFHLKHAFYGKEYAPSEIENALNQFGMSFDVMDYEALIQQVAQDLADGKIVGWFQGRFEMGPRALGNRSILADARRADMKDILNARVKHREAFRPFAPVILQERVSDWFQIDQADPFMTIAPRVRPEKAGLIPSGVHLDGTARIQTVEREANERYYDLIHAFEALTGVPIILNTSFNRQEPIVARPEEAISCFLRTDMDVLVMGDHYSTDHNEQSVRLADERFAHA
jgi:carbamoyltransferase